MMTICSTILIEITIENHQRTPNHINKRMKLVDLRNHIFTEGLKDILQQVEDDLWDAYRQDDSHNSLTTPKQVIQAINGAVPKHQYLETIVDWYIRGQFTFDDLSELNSNLIKFSKLEEFNNLKGTDKNLFSYKELARMLPKYDETDFVPRKEKLKKLKETGVTVVFNNDEGILYQANNFMGAIELAEFDPSDTRPGWARDRANWCISAFDPKTAEEQFNRYTDKGRAKAYIFQPKDEPNERYAIVLYTRQYEDKYGNAINFSNLLNKYPSLIPALKEEARKHNISEFQRL